MCRRSQGWVGASAGALGPDAKARPHAARVHSKKLADVDESERPIMPLGCDPFENFQPFAVPHAEVSPLNTPNGVFEYRCYERDFGEEQLRPRKQVRWKLDTVVGDRGVLPGLGIAYVLPYVLEHRSPLSKPSFHIEIRHGAVPGHHRETPVREKQWPTA